MPPKNKSQEPVYGSVRTRLRSTCIDSCPNYPELREEAEEEQKRVNAAIDAGQNLIGRNVKIVCLYDPTRECPGAVYAPPLEEN